MDDRAEAEAILANAGRAADDAIDLAEVALALAALRRPGVGLTRYRAHLHDLRETVATAPPRDHIAALAYALVERHGYQGDRETFDDVQNANLMRVIDRRRGLPVALGILYLDAARAQGWAMTGLRFPGHFLLCLEGRERIVVDPFDRCRRVNVAALRSLLKRTEGGEAELRPAHYLPAGNRDILLRLQNNIKLRLLRAGRADEAAQVLHSMLLLAPDRADLWHEIGMVHNHLGNLGAALRAFERFRDCADEDGARHHAAAMIQSIKSRLN